jgi:FemAB-related protein (PEP-CTERM system-associated)
VLSLMANVFSIPEVEAIRTQLDPVIRILDDADAFKARAWDDFVLEHDHGSPFHLLAWKRTIEEAFGYKPFYLVALDGKKIEGVLPLFFVKNLVVGRALISTPFAVYGGALCRTEAARSALTAQVAKLGEELGVGYVELRNEHESQCLGFEPISRYVTFTGELSPDPEQLLKAIPRKTRAIVRKSLAQGFTTHMPGRDLKTFELLYARSLRRLGTPCFPSRLFESLMRNFGQMAEVREVHFNGSAVAAVLSFYFRDRVLPYYGASEPAFNGQAPSSFMYFDLMRSAGWQGLKKYDFGRSRKNSGGSHDFKAHWGMEVRDLPYEMLLVRRKELPHFSPANPKYQFAIRAWRKMPLGLARAIGPLLIRFFP